MIDPGLGVTPLSVVEPARLQQAAAIELVLHASDNDAVLRQLRALNPQAHVDADGAIRVVVDRRGSADPTPALPQHRAPSFVVDFDQPSVEALVGPIVARHGETPTLPQLRAFVTEHLHQVEHGTFDFASRAATRRRGDCTEHAVLLGALARRFGHAARIVLGVVAPLEGPAYAFGHAWTQVHTGQAWETHDAALQGATQVVYLPFLELSDEGPGYALALGSGMLSQMAIGRIELAPVD